MQHYCTRAKARPNIPEDDGRSLLAIDQYGCELAAIDRLSMAEEQELVQRARQGDQEARTLLIESCLRYVYSVASRYVRQYSVSSLEVMDVAQVGNEAVVRHLDESLRGHSPCAFLRVSAWQAIAHYSMENKLIIRVPRTSYRHGRRAPLTISLMTPLSGDDDKMLLDLLEDADWQALREAVCDELGCEYPATSFDGEALEFRCDEHVEVQV